MRKSLIPPILLLLLASIAPPGTAESPLRDYQERLARAERLIDPLIDGEPAATEVVAAAQETKSLLPRHEDVDFNGQPVSVDNSWLHQTLDAVIENANGDDEQIRSMLIEIADRLSLLQGRIEAPAGPAAADHKSKLDAILARPEYRPEQRQESTVKKWLRRLLDRILDLLGKLGSNKRPDDLHSGSKTITGLRILLTVFLAAALASGATYLARRLIRHRKRRREEREEVREILGEAIAADISPADLLLKAREMAFAGDFRSAIRRAYIALLCELERDGKLKLGRSRTNRDYLEDMRREKLSFQDFARMTSIFEQTWYGEKNATGREFDGFLELYRNTASDRS